ncbi:MAG: hypothetical protein KA250_06920 [Verrucomicrobiales bacterium]|jgi:hypothetical protein|nr:hypothetical protein [Verrucomicrobiales bacterium]MBP9224306.1 hypothetical protein [Verrucomicrobiales bacterium]
MTILLTGTRAPATLDLARRLWREGVRVIGADSLRYPLGKFSQAFASHYRVPSPRLDRRAYLNAILDIVEKEGVTLLWPTCEEIFHLATIHGEFPDGCRLLFDPIAVLDPLHDKLRFARFAGHHAPESWDGPDAPDRRTTVWKPRYSRFATRVRFGLKPFNPNGWMGQSYVRGDEFSSWSLCVEGEIRTMTFYDCPARVSHGSGCAFEPMWEENAAAMIAEFASSLNFTGSLAFDFIRGYDGKLYVLECNPRLTSGIHVLDPAVRISDLLARPGELPPPMVPAQIRIATMFSKPSVAWSSPDVIAATDDPGPARGQFAGIAEYLGIAIRHFHSLTSATTRDIEYNGEAGEDGA